MMAAPVCSMTLLSFNLGNEISADCEQNPPGFRKYGFDEGDFLIASAPRPVLLGVQDNDFFDPAGTEELYQEVCRIYRLFNAENQLIFSIGHGDHSYAECQQHAVGNFFHRWRRVIRPETMATFRFLKNPSFTAPLREVSGSFPVRSRREGFSLI